jgi:uridine kinase
VQQARDESEVLLPPSAGLRPAQTTMASRVFVRSSLPHSIKVGLRPIGVPLRFSPANLPLNLPGSGYAGVPFVSDRLPASVRTTVLAAAHGTRWTPIDHVLPAAMILPHGLSAVDAAPPSPTSAPPASVAAATAPTSRFIPSKMARDGRVLKRAPGLDSILAAVACARARHDRPVVVALDGRSGVGKSTLARTVSELLDARLVTCDDFWAGGSDALWASRTPAELAAQAIDWRRLRAELLEPLLAGQRARWRAFDWRAEEGLSADALVCDPAPVIVLDGAYSARPELADMVDVAVLLTLPDEARRKRLLAREGAAFMRRWHSLWDPAEEYYFGHVRMPAAFDVVSAAEDCRR